MLMHNESDFKHYSGSGKEYIRSVAIRLYEEEQ